MTHFQKTITEFQLICLSPCPAECVYIHFRKQCVDPDQLILTKPSDQDPH